VGRAGFVCFQLGWWRGFAGRVSGRVETGFVVRRCEAVCAGRGCGCGGLVRHYFRERRSDAL